MEIKRGSLGVERLRRRTVGLLKKFLKLNRKHNQLQLQISNTPTRQDNLSKLVRLGWRKKRLDKAASVYTNRMGKINTVMKLKLLKKAAREGASYLHN